MNFSPSPFWGGVLAVTFYQLVCTNPVSFLSLGLGMTIGFVLTLYAVGVLVFRGYISMTGQLAEILGDSFRQYPMLVRIFGNYVGNLFDTLYPNPNPSCFNVPRRGPTCGPPGPVCCPTRVSPPPFNLDGINITDIMKHIDIGEIMKNIDTRATPNSDEDTEVPVDVKEETVVIPVEVTNEKVPDVVPEVPDVVPEVPESCRGVHDADGNHIKEEEVRIPVKSPKATDLDVKVGSSPVRRKSVPRSRTNEPKPL